MSTPKEPMTATEVAQRVKDARLDDLWLGPMLDRVWDTIREHGDVDTGTQDKDQT